MKLLFRSIPVWMLMFAVGLVQAQSARQANRNDPLLDYDARQEQLLSGTVAALLPQPSTGMIAGSHLLLTTTNGTMDVSLGTFALRGKDALSVSAAESIEVIGVMRSFNGKPLFLARAVTVRDHTYAIRNEHGIPVTPKARERASDNQNNQETR
jgi:hypothetical protein